MNEFFRRFSTRCSTTLGSAWAFILALTFTLIWIVSRPLFDSTDSWMIFMGGVTGVVTFLMVFIIQNSQNRDAKAIHLKLDELIRSVEQARNSLVDLEDLSDDEIAQLEEEFRSFRRRSAETLNLVEVKLNQITENDGNQ